LSYRSINDYSKLIRKLPSQRLKRLFKLDAINAAYVIRKNIMRNNYSKNFCSTVSSRRVKLIKNQTMGIMCQPFDSAQGAEKLNPLML